eukprot:c9813_g1_i1.p2 GENE.c9813_g1_i1~~c9813_g1_i1.p2  ORF type:complete len:274 (+),score=45.40 c9813_g1_i1:55-876(+)
MLPSRVSRGLSWVLTRCKTHQMDSIILDTEIFLKKLLLGEQSGNTPEPIQATLELIVQSLTEEFSYDPNLSDSVARYLDLVEAGCWMHRQYEVDIQELLCHLSIVAISTQNEACKQLLAHTLLLGDVQQQPHSGVLLFAKVFASSSEKCVWRAVRDVTQVVIPHIQFHQRMAIIASQLGSEYQILFLHEVSITATSMLMEDKQSIRVFAKQFILTISESQQFGVEWKRLVGTQVVDIINNMHFIENSSYQWELFDLLDKLQLQGDRDLGRVFK